MHMFIFIIIKMKAIIKRNDTSKYTINRECFSEEMLPQNNRDCLKESQSVRSSGFDKDEQISY